MKPLLIAAICLALPVLAHAHAFLDHADPKVGSTIDQSPPELRVTFTDAVVPSSSTIKVTASDGSQIDKKDVHCDAADAKILVVSLPPLKPGIYKVHWHVVCACCGQMTEGDFKFTVKGP